MDYRNPPILEVYAETVVVPNENACAFNKGTVEDFFVRADPYVIKEGKFQNSLDITHNQKGQVQNFKYNATLEGVRAYSENETKCIEISKNAFSLHYLKSTGAYSYPGFDSFIATYEKYLDIYWDFFRVDFGTRLELVYKDKIIIPRTQIKLHEYFNLFPVVNMPNYNNLIYFDISGTAIIPNCPGDTLSVSLKPINAGGNSESAFMLEWVAATAFEDAVSSTSDVLSSLKKLHNHIITAFQQAFKAPTLALFEPIEE